MKKVLVTTMVALLVFGMTLQAQTKMNFGPKAGVTLANLSGSDAGDTKSKVGFVGGAFLGIGVSPQFMIQPELLYVMKGAKDDSAGITGKLKLNYVEVPILIKWMAPTQGSVKPCLFVGAAPAFNMSAKASADSAGLSGEVDIKDDIKNIDFGLVFGGGLGFTAGTGQVDLDVRYTMGLSSIDDTGAKADIKNACFSATLGYVIGIGK